LIKKIDHSETYCGEPPNISQALQLGLEARASNGLFAYGTVITYLCYGFLRFEDGTSKANITCSQVDTWDQSVFSCAGMVWYCSIVWYSIVWYGSIVWYSMVWYGMLWFYRMVWYDMERFDRIVWYGSIVWYGIILRMVWYGSIVWYGMVLSYGMV